MLSIISERIRARLLIIELDALWGEINRTTTVRPALLLVLLLGEALAAGNDEVAVRAVGVVIAHILITGEARIDILVLRDAREWHVGLLLRFGNRLRIAAFHLGKAGGMDVTV